MINNLLVCGKIQFLFFNIFFYMWNALKSRNKIQLYSTGEPGESGSLGPRGLE